MRLEFENASLIDVPDDQLLDRALLRVPERRQVLASPRGRTAAPVHGDTGLPYFGRGLHYLRWVRRN